MTRRRPAVRTGGSLLPVMTLAVAASTVVVSVAALLSSRLMGSTTQDLVELRGGQWWRVVSPVFVQPSGWGQLVFNVAGLVVVGAALERRLGRATWLLVYLAGGAGSVAVLSAWEPADLGGGSSDAVAALVGALAVVVAVGGMHERGEWVAQVYSVFFAVYLTGLALGGVVPSMIAGNLSIIVLFSTRRAWSPARLNTVCLLVIAGCGVVMTVVAREGHGVGILAGVTIAALARWRSRLLVRSAHADTWRTITTLVAAVVVSEVVWIAWVHLIGVELVVTTSLSGRASVGWVSVGAVAAISCLARAAQHWLGAHQPERATGLWLGVCICVAVVSVAAPARTAVGTSSLAGLVCLHVACAAVTITMLTPRRGSEWRGRPHSGDRGRARTRRDRPERPMPRPVVSDRSPGADADDESRSLT